MNMKIYSVYDTKACAFCTPFFQVNHATAIRAFQNATVDSMNGISANPEDYQLFYLGTFYPGNGEIEPTSERLCGGLEARNAIVSKE